LIGQYARDKDGAVACLLMAQLVAHLKAQHKTVHQRLAEIQQQHGCHEEALVNVQMEGSEGMAQMARLMAAFRSDPPRQLAGIEVSAVRDYKSLTTRTADGAVHKLEADSADMVILDLVLDGNYFAVRPSGTEPKVKFYMFTSLPAAESVDLTRAKEKLATRLADLEVDIRRYVADKIG
jgi:phosphoglucomutase/phosphomannomutase